MDKMAEAIRLVYVEACVRIRNETGIGGDTETRQKFESLAEALEAVYPDEVKAAREKL